MNATQLLQLPQPINQIIATAQRQSATSSCTRPRPGAVIFIATHFSFVRPHALHRTVFTALALKRRRGCLHRLELASCVLAAAHLPWATVLLRQAEEHYDTAVIPRRSLLGCQDFGTMGFWAQLFDLSGVGFVLAVAVVAIISVALCFACGARIKHCCTKKTTVLPTASARYKVLCAPCTWDRSSYPHAATGSQSGVVRWPSHRSTKRIPSRFPSPLWTWKLHFASTSSTTTVLYPWVGSTTREPASCSTPSAKANALRPQPQHSGRQRSLPWLMHGGQRNRAENLESRWCQSLVPLLYKRTGGACLVAC